MLKEFFFKSLLLSVECLLTKKTGKRQEMSVIIKIFIHVNNELSLLKMEDSKQSYLPRAEVIT